MEYFVNSDYEVLTENGFQDFSGVKQTHSKTMNIEFKEDDNKIVCTYNHQLKTISGFKEADKIQIGEIIGKYTVKSIEYNEKTENVYDLIDVKNTNHYITNDVTSHNCAHVDKFAEFYASAYPGLSSGKKTKMIMVSTPNGLNSFWEFWDKAQKGENGFNPIEITWQKVPTFNRNPNFKEETLAALNFNLQKFEQEYEVAFLGSSGTLISGYHLQKLSFVPPLEVNEHSCQYEKPIKDHKYITICDVARGRGLDYSAFSVIDVTSLPFKQIFTYRDNMITPLDYSEIIYRVSKSYNNSYCLVEINDIGQQVADSLFNDYEYENIIYTQSKGRSGKQAIFGVTNSSDRGVRTTKTVKSVGCAILKLLIEQDKLVIRDKETIHELSTFSRKGDSYEAETGKHDDLVIGLVLFAWLSDQQLFTDINDINTLSMLKVKSEEDLENELLTFFVDDTEDLEEIFADPKDNWMFQLEVSDPEMEERIDFYPNEIGSSWKN